MWGFADSSFEVKDGVVRLSSHRYSSGGQALENFAPFVEKAVGVPFDPADKNVPKKASVPPARSCEALSGELVQLLGQDQLRSDESARLRHGRGHHLEEVYLALFGQIAPVPDLVAFPSTDEQIQGILKLAKAHRALVVPYGGGTCVSEALKCPETDRIIISLDLSKMDAIEWIDPEAKTACIQGGAVGRAIEKQLGEVGFTLGHEPDSIEFSTMGGWIATNASGMKKNRYGNIEDILLDVTVVTEEGVVRHPCVVPRASHGLDVRKLALGSEGTLGVITRCVVTIRPLPEVQNYGSLVFPTWEKGLAFMEELSTLQALPASVRLVDNLQFQFGRALKPAKSSAIAQTLQKLFVTQIHGIDLEKMVACTLVYEGQREEQRSLEKRVNRLARRYGGFPAGGVAGKDGYNLTFGIAYIRDFLLQHWTFGDSFETSCPWGKVNEVIEAVKVSIDRVHQELGLAGRPFVTSRISQVYPTGCCIYFYIGAHYKGLEDPIAGFRRFEDESRAAILGAGGSLSHHHGVGKSRRNFLSEIKSEHALVWIERTQKSLDPDGIFASGNQGLEPAAS